MSKGRASLQPLPGVDNQKLDPEDERVFIAVMREVKPVSDWSMLASYLGIDCAVAQAIRKENRRVYTEIQAYVKAWLNTGNATWAMLAAALREDLVGKKAVGNAIKAKYRSDRNNEITETIPVPPADGVDDSLLSTLDFKEVMEALRNVTEWSILSILLGVKESTLRHIYKDNEGHAYQAEQAIVEAWLGDTDEPSWAMLVTALQDDLVGMNGIGKKIGKQHSKSGVQPSPSSAATPNATSTALVIPVIPDTDVHQLQKSELYEVLDFLRSETHRWDDIGRGLKVEFSYRQSLKNQGVQTGDRDKLEDVFQKWFESKLSPVTWENLARALIKLQFKEIVEAIVKNHLQ